MLHSHLEFSFVRTVLTFTLLFLVKTKAMLNLLQNFGMTTNSNSLIWALEVTNHSLSSYMSTTKKMNQSDKSTVAE